MNSFFPDTVKSWNIIGSEFTSLRSISLFKNSLLSLIRPAKKSVFGIHNPGRTRTLFQLRLGLSDLKSHKMHHKFPDIDSEFCACYQEAETTIHFFCSCSFFTTLRISLVDTVSEVLVQNDIFINTLVKKELVKIYLYGSDKFTDVDNRIIILATIKFITDSNRFSFYLYTLDLVAKLPLYFPPSPAPHHSFFIGIQSPHD